MRLSGKVAVIAGSGAQMSRATALLFAIPAEQQGRTDTSTAIALNMTTTLFIGASGTFGALLGWVGAWLIKSAAKR